MDTLPVLSRKPGNMHLFFKLCAPVESPTATDLSGGLGPFLRQESQYSLFNKVVHKLNATFALNPLGWNEVSLTASILAGTNNSLCPYHAAKKLRSKQLHYEINAL